RSSGMRAAATVVMLVALAVPGYLAYQDPAPFRGGLSEITPGLDGTSDVQSTPSPQLIPVDSAVSQSSQTAQALQSPQAADAPREPPPAHAHTNIEKTLPTHN